jgi:hypothetical protein
MPLIFTGQKAPVPGLDVTSHQASDANTASPVRVYVSREATDDHDLPRIQRAASRKYDRGERESDGGVFVRTADC